MNPFIRDSLIRALRSGGISVFEDISNGLTNDELERFITALKRVQDRRIGKAKAV